MDHDTRKPSSDDRIDLETPDDIIYWSAKFSVTAQELRRAVHEVGANAADVERHIAQHRAMRPSAL
jgi:hypothetical protein